MLHAEFQKNLRLGSMDMWKIKGYITSKILNLAPKPGLRASLPSIQRAPRGKVLQMFPASPGTDLGSSWEATYWEIDRRINLTLQWTDM